MPRRRKPVRLVVRKPRGPGRHEFWYIVDGAREVSTGCSPDDVAGAQAKLEEYLGANHRPPDGERRPSNLYVTEIVTAYLREHAANSRSKDWLVHTAAPIIEWWAGKLLSEVVESNCRAYVEWRTAQAIKAFRKRPARTISDQTARHELKTLRTAINWYNRQHQLAVKPAVWLPPKAAPRQDYWLTTSQVAARIRAARARPETHHLVRLILIGFYSGTRPGAIMRLRWLPSPVDGWIDVERGLLHRRGEGAPESKKRRPTAPIHERLLRHVRHWQKIDAAKGIASVIHYDGRPIAGKVRRSWETVRKLAGHSTKDSPHVLRHTAATWLMQSGVDLAQISGYLGMTVETLQSTYGHHHPDFMRDAARVRPGKRVASGGRK
jgi:integrase